VIPDGYNWEICTQENYVSSSSSPSGPLAGVRKLTDTAYHGHYTAERQRFQDDLVLRLLPPSTTPLKEPVLLFTAGAMGVGKSFVIRWMAESGLLPLSEFALIDPDRIAQQLPEWQGYFRHDPMTASLMTRLEAGLITELGLVHALQQRRNILVDSSLRHGSWYARVLERLRHELPEVRIVLLYVHTSEETIHRRAQERGRDGRVAPSTEVQDSLQRMARAVSRLLPHVDFFAQVANDDGKPHVTSVCGSLDKRSAVGNNVEVDDEDKDDDEDTTCGVIDPAAENLSAKDVGWSELIRVLARAVAGGEAASPLPEPPRILPTAGGSTEMRPLMTLLQTVVFAAEKHRGQTRKDPQRTPYINHPLAVSRILAEVGIRDLQTLQVALLHDTLEDTDTTVFELRQSFGQEVAALVESLTDDDSLRPSMRKLRQLRGAKALGYKAKLVRIADKLHNVWDILHHGIPGWTQERTDKYVAWACELVTALKGSNPGLEQRFFAEISLPEGYKLGDWEKGAVEQADDWAWEHISGLPSEPPAAELPAETLDEHKAVYSLLLAAEFLAQHQKNGRDQGADSGAGFSRALNVALVLAQHGIRDSETLQAALVRDALSLAGGTSDEITPGAPTLVDKVRTRFGAEVAQIVGSLASCSERDGEGLKRLPAKAKLILLAEMFWDLRAIQIGGLANERDARAFRECASQARVLRRALRGSNEELEAGLDDVFNGQVRLASGKLVAVAEALKRPVTT